MGKLAVISTILCILCTSTSVNGEGTKLHPRLLASFQKGGEGSTQNVIIYFNKNIKTVIHQINSQTFRNITEKQKTLTAAEIAFTNKCQGPLKTYLDLRGIKYLSYWIANVMIIKNADQHLVRLVTGFPNVVRVEKEASYRISKPPPSHIRSESYEESNTRNTSGYKRHAWGDLAWGVQRVRADLVWDWYTGRGVVVVNIDTGVRGTHQALRGNWRRQYGWFDASDDEAQEPTDTDGHGTHTMGTIAGKGGVGVAPQATWIACRASTTSKFMWASALLKCGEWIQCPTRPDGTDQDCLYAPRVVGLSWGIIEGDPGLYDSVINSWTAANIIPVASIGNDGPACDTGSAPATRDGAIAVGSTSRDDSVSYFSSRGPTTDGRILPDIVAPGDIIPSAHYESDDAYEYYRGTSMSAPTVVGVIALMLQKNSQLKFEQVYNIITKHAVRDHFYYYYTCGNATNDAYPNNVHGYGRIDALNAIKAMSKFCFTVC